MFGEDFFSSLTQYGEEERPKKPNSPPHNRHDWLQNHKFKEWPETPSHDLESRGPAGILGELEDIRQDLIDNARWDNAILDNVDSHLKTLEDKLSELSQRFLCEDENAAESSDETGGIRIIREKDRARDFCNPDMLKAMCKPLTAHRKTSDSTDESGKRVEQTVFPGFPGGIAPPLPGKVEPLPVLDLVTKLQNFNSSLQKHWRTTFLSEDSCSLMQFIFWWLWMERFESNSHQQAILFTKMAESFAMILLNCDKKKKDELFLHFTPCLCQAVYCVFCQAFPNSVKLFHSYSFLQWLCDCIYEWTLGVPSPIGCWDKWPMNSLDPTYIIDQPVTISTRDKELDLNTSQMEKDLSAQLLKMGTLQLNRSISSRKKVARQISDDESPHIGPGPTFECVQFGITGRSPLLQHHFLTHGLSDASQSKGPIMSRTQIKKLAPPSMTYNELLQTVTDLSQQRYQVYEREITAYQQEIHKAITKHHATAREMQRHTQKLLQQRNEVSIQAEKIMATYTPQTTTRTGTDNIPLHK